MATSLLVDTDVLIDYFNRGDLAELFDGARFRIFYSVVTRKELLAKPGLSAAERSAILGELRRFRQVPLSSAIAARYWDLRRRHPRMEKADALIAATALVKRLPLLTGNSRHFRQIEGLTLFPKPRRF
jgi:hypothetical protein